MRGLVNGIGGTVMERNDMPTPTQLRELAARYRTILDYGLSGMTLGDNEAARVVMACEFAADVLESALSSADR